MDDDLVANLDVSDLAAGLDHHSSRVGARDMRQDDFHPGQAAPRPDIVEVAGRRLDVNHDVVGARLGYRRVAILQDLAAAVLLENNRLHAKSLP